MESDFLPSLRVAAGRPIGIFFFSFPSRSPAQTFITSSPTSIVLAFVVALPPPFPLQYNWITQSTKTRSTWFNFLSAHATTNATKLWIWSWTVGPSFFLAVAAKSSLLGGRGMTWLRQNTKVPFSKPRVVHKNTAHLKEGHGCPLQVFENWEWFVRLLGIPI